MVRGDAKQTAESLQAEVHGSGTRVEHVAPHRRNDDRRDDDRQDEDRSVETPELETLGVEQDRDEHADDDVDDHVAERPPEVEQDQADELEVRDLELRRGDPDVVVETDELRRDRITHPEIDLSEVMEGHPDLERQRVEGDDG